VLSICAASSEGKQRRARTKQYRQRTASLATLQKDTAELEERTGQEVKGQRNGDMKGRIRASSDSPGG